MAFPQFFANRMRDLGSFGEDVAAKYLRKAGYRVVERNFRCKFGEIDLIVERDEYLVFVEVKTRTRNKYSINPLISITEAKRRRIRLLSQLYSVQNQVYSKQPRFDVIGVEFITKRDYKVEHIENAF